ncbi:MAG: ATPase, T2SS/T4P/T4SS family, partial [Ilumatobacteraceae bacterium]
MSRIGTHLVSRWSKQSAPARPAATPTALVTPLTDVDLRPRLGDVLVAEHKLAPEELAGALNLQVESGRQLGVILVEQGVLDAHALTDALATQFGLPTVDLRDVRPTDDALALVDEEIARRFRIVPMAVTDGALDVAIADASDASVREALTRLDVDEVNVFLAAAEDVATSLNTYYRALTSTDESVQEFWRSNAARQQIEAVIGATDEAPIITLVNKIVTQALRDRASDIHIEPTAGRMRIRYRIDGSLREVLSLPDSAGPELISRIKIMAEMDIVERRRPQDGQFEMVVDGAGVDVRVATAATIFGETAVLRLLDKSHSIKGLSELGMPLATY